MYLSHFGLRKKPFGSSPDPGFFYPSSTHQEAQRTILRGIESRAGLIWLSGGPGLGKTTVLRSVIERLDSEKVQVISLTNPDVSYRGLLEVVYTHLGVELPVSPGLIDLGHHLYRALQQAYEQGRNVVLMIDDVQKMPIRTMACILHLQNLETDGQKLIQVVLAGREPELSNILKMGRLKQFRGKVVHRAVIAPLHRDESMEYIRFRVTSVAGVKRFPFTQTALKQIVDHCGGNPRHLNLFCERALEAGWRREENPVGVTTVKDVVAGLLSIDSDGGKATSRSSVGIAVALMAALWLVTLGLTLFREGRTGADMPGTVVADSASPRANSVEAPSSGAGLPGEPSAKSGSQSAAPNARIPFPPGHSTAGGWTEPSYPPKVGLPRIDRLPDEAGSSVTWVYGPRDLHRPDGARSRDSSPLVSDKKGSARSAPPGPADVRSKDKRLPKSP
jgi:type II secretory pathway predicted ATPase ExeA